jgi:hypothetical protein
MSMTDENHRGTIGRFGEHLLDHRGIGLDARTFQEPFEQTGPPHRGGITDEWIRQQNMPTTLDEQARDAEVGDGDERSGVSTIGGSASDAVRSRGDWSPDDGRGLPAGDDQ